MLSVAAAAVASRCDQCPVELCRVTRLLTVLGGPPLKLLLSAFGIVFDRRPGVVRRLLGEKRRAEEPRIHRGGENPEWRMTGKTAWVTVIGPIRVGPPRPALPPRHRRGLSRPV